MQYLVNDFGDGCCIEIGFYNSLIDFGSQQSGTMPKKGGFFRCNDWDKLIISHYHTDHYNLLYKINDGSIEINKLIYPHIPTIVGIDDIKENELIKLVLFFNMVSVFSDSGVPSYGLINLLDRKTRHNFSKCRVKRGEQIDIYNESYHVIWPPGFIDPASGTSKPLISGIKKIHNIIAEDSLIKELWEEFENKCSNINTEHEDIDEGEYAPRIFLKNEDKERIKPTKDKLSKAIRGITNRLSICLYKDDTFLFLGDLESEEIKICIDYLKKEFFINHTNFFIAPHHGTHWNDRLLDIYAENLIVNNGKKMIVHFEEKFKNISGSRFHTYSYGDIFFDDEDRTVYPKKMWRYFRPFF